jgi:hypothetical protein
MFEPDILHKYIPEDDSMLLIIYRNNPPGRTLRK